MAFFDQLRKASFRGVPFGVLTSEGRFGRRVALHEYPLRDKAYPEDLGRAVRRFTVVGFLIADSRVYGGGDVIGQRERLIAAVETAGKGALVHPTYGELQVSCPDGGCTVLERWDQGRYFEITFNLIEAGERLFPTAAASGADRVETAGTATQAAAAEDYVDKADAAVQKGAAVVSQAQKTAADFVKVATTVTRDATSLLHLASQLHGPFGRYFNGANVGGFGAGLSSALKVGTTVTDLVGVGAALRANVAVAADGVTAAVSRFGLSSSAATDVATAAGMLTTAVRQSSANPADGLRLLSTLCSFQPQSTRTPAAVGQAIGTMADCMGSLFRRSAMVDLARTASAYQPRSYDDAAAVRTMVAGLIDTEALSAADAGDDASYAALKGLRRAVSQDLTARGADLAHVKEFAMPSNLPALALASRYYGDADRMDELLYHADPPHPAFMPAQFKALAV